MQQLSQNLSANLAALDRMFGPSADYYAKEITIYHCKAVILLFDGMASLDSLWTLLLDAASRQAPPVQPGQCCTGMQAYELILHDSAFPAENAPVEDMDELTKRLTAGMAVLLLDGCAKGIAFSVQGLKFRSVGEPSGEGNLRGSREGFADLLRVNLSLLRRLIRSEQLVQEAAQADTGMRTEYAICYCKNKADPAMVQHVRKTLAAAKPELLLDSSYFVPWLLPGKARLFTPVSYTERPAVVAAKLCEGKIVVLVNGSPSAMVLPALFCENFECLDDYASTAVFSSFLRVLKYISFYLTVFLPGGVRVSGGLSAGADPAAAAVQDRSGRKGNAAAAVCRNAAGHAYSGSHPGSGSADASVAGALGQSGVGPYHRGCRHCHRAYEHAGDLCGKHHGHCGVRHALFVRACYAAASGCGAGCRSCRAGGPCGGAFLRFCSAYPVRPVCRCRIWRRTRFHSGPWQRMA